MDVLMELRRHGLAEFLLSCQRRGRRSTPARLPLFPGQSSRSASQPPALGARSPDFRMLPDTQVGRLVLRRESRSGNFSSRKFAHSDAWGKV